MSQGQESQNPNKRKNINSLTELNFNGHGPLQKLIKQHTDSVPGSPHINENTLDESVSPSYNTPKSQYSQMQNQTSTFRDQTSQVSNQQLADIIEQMNITKENLDKFLQLIGDLKNQPLDEKFLKKLLKIKFDIINNFQQFYTIYEIDIQKMISSKQVKKNWNQDDILILIWLTAKYCIYHNVDINNIPDNDWINISLVMPGKCAESCKFKWLQMSKVSSNRIPWSKKDNQILKDLVQQSKDQNGGNYQWVEISKDLFKITGEKIFRSSKQCREHYHNFLDPNLKNTKWSYEEEIILITMQGKIGNKWSEIAKQLPGRTDNSVKNRYMSLKTKKLNNIEALKSYHSLKSIESNKAIQQPLSQNKIADQKLQQKYDQSKQNLNQTSQINIKQEQEDQGSPNKNSNTYLYNSYQQSHFKQNIPNNHDITNQTSNIDNDNNSTNIGNCDNKEYISQAQSQSKDQLKKYNYEDEIYLESEDNQVNNREQQQQQHQFYQYDDNNNQINEDQIQQMEDQEQEFISESEETDEQNDIVNSMGENNINRNQPKCSILLNNHDDQLDNFTLVKNFENMEINEKWMPAYINLETKQVILVNQQDYASVGNFNSQLSFQHPQNLSLIQQQNLKQDFANKVTFSSRRFSNFSEQNQNQQNQQQHNQNLKRASLINNHNEYSQSNNNINYKPQHPLEGILVGFPYKSLDSIASISPAKDYQLLHNNQNEGIEQEGLISTLRKYTQKRNSIQSFQGQLQHHGDNNNIKNMMNSDQYDQYYPLQANQTQFLQNNFNNQYQQTHQIPIGKNNLNQELQYLGIQREHSFTELNQAEGSEKNANITLNQYQVQNYEINELPAGNNNTYQNTKNNSLNDISMHISPNYQLRQNFSNNNLLQNYRRNSSLKQLNNFLAENYANNLLHKKYSKNSLGGQISLSNINHNFTNSNINNQTQPKFSLESSAGIKAFQQQNNLQSSNNQNQSHNNSNISNNNNFSQIQYQSQYDNNSNNIFINSQNQNRNLPQNNPYNMQQQDNVIQQQQNNFQATYTYLENSAQNNNNQNGINMETQK